MAVTDPVSRIERLIAGAEIQFQVEFLAALQAVRSSINLDDLAELLQQARFAEAFEIVGVAAARLGIVYAQQFVAAGIDTGNFLTANVGEIVIGFDQTNVRAVGAMRNNQLRLVTNFTEQQRRATQQTLIEGVREGVNPRQMARRFRQSIGLTESQERWVRNYERALRNLDRNALGRELRDRRFDSTVRRAIDSGEPLSQKQIDKMVRRYRERTLKLRSETIARTEALRSVHEGAAEMYAQAFESGQLLPEQIARDWNTALDERVRDFSRGAQTSHVTMHLQRRSVGIPFTSGAGNQALHPGSFGVGMEDINCRCVVSTRILTLAEVGVAQALVIR